MKTLKIIFTSVLFSFLFISCQTTTLLVDKNIKADIYVNGIKKGTKQTEIKKRGLPQKIVVTAKYQGVTIAEATYKRSFDWKFVIVGCYTYGIAILNAWSYPEIIIINTSNPENIVDPWNNPKQSAWSLPAKQ